MSSNSNLVSCIMPTANRQEFVKHAISLFLAQDYANRELVIIDDGIDSCIDLSPTNDQIRYFYYRHSLGTIGTKRNIACEKSRGQFILHWDDDDWYAQDWISRQVELLDTTKADLVGLNKVSFYSPAAKRGMVYEDTGTNRPWLCGATFGYRKSLWEQYKFADLQIGEDTDFLINSGAKLAALDYPGGFTAGLHPGNTSIKHLDDFNQLEFKNLNIDNPK